MISLSLNELKLVAKVETLKTVKSNLRMNY